MTDIIIAILLLFSAINGFRKGFISEIASIAAFILGIWGALKFNHLTANFLINYLQLDTEYLNLISIILTFIIIIIAIKLAAKFVSKFLEAIMLGFINRVAGLFFGLFRAALILSILFLIIEHFDVNKKIISESTQNSSKFYEPIKKFAPSLLPFLMSIDLPERDIEKADDNISACRSTSTLVNTHLFSNEVD